MSVKPKQQTCPQVMSRADSLTVRLFIHNAPHDCRPLLLANGNLALYPSAPSLGPEAEVRLNLKACVEDVEAPPRLRESARLRSVDTHSVQPQTQVRRLVAGRLQHVNSFSHLAFLCCCSFICISCSDARKQARHQLDKQVVKVADSSATRLADCRNNRPLSV